MNLRLGVLTATALMLSGCMWAASSVVCQRPAADVAPLMTAHLVAGETARSEAGRQRAQALMALSIWADGGVRYYNDSYEWCQQLEPLQLGRAKEALAKLAERSADAEAVMEHLLDNGGTLVEIRSGSTGRLERPFSRISVHSPGLKVPGDNWQAVDALFCAIESAMGRGYRYQLSKHFGDVLDARGRTEACDDTED